MKMKKETIVWLSRHPMNAEQESYWKGISPDVEIVHENVTWANSSNGYDDCKRNLEMWNRLVSQYKPTCFAGVFPVVAMEAVNHRIPMYSSVSEQNEVERQDGTKQIVFKHVRWSADQNPNNRPNMSYWN